MFIYYGKIKTLGIGHPIGGCCGLRVRERFCSNSHKEDFWGNGNGLYLDWNGDDMTVSLLKLIKLDN